MEQGRYTEYRLLGPDGTHIATHVRRDLPDGEKSMWWRLPDGSRGLGGLPAAELPLYGAQSAASWAAGPVFVVEGEKAAEALMRRGLHAVGTVTGASGTPGHRALAILRHREVRLWPDNDEVGQHHMERLAERLAGVATSVSFVEWAAAPEHGDAADFLVGHSADDVLALPVRGPADAVAPGANAAEGSGPRVYTVRELAELPSADEEYIVGEGILTRGGKALLYGKSGSGKTTLLDFLSGSLATGTPFLGQYEVDRPRRVLVVQGELSLPEMASHAQQLVAAGFGSDQLLFARMTDLKLPAGEETLRALVAAHRAEILALDPWYRLFSGESSNAFEQVGLVFDVCDRFLEEALVEAVIVVHHANVTGQRTAGSWIFEGWPSTILRLEPLEGVPDQRILQFEKIRAPGSTLQGLRLQIRLGEDGYLPVIPEPAKGAEAGPTLAVLVVREAGGQLRRQDLLAGLMAKARVQQRAANKYLGAAVQRKLLRRLQAGREVLYQTVEPEEAGRA